MMVSAGRWYTDTGSDERSAAHATDDAQLIARTQAGDIQAFNLLVERYQQRVYALCFRMVGGWDADDVTQEVFFAAYRAIRLYRGGSFIAWLLRIASNRCLDSLRARGKRPHVSLDADDDDRAPLQLRAPGESPDQRVLRAELAESLERVLAELAADQRLVVILSDIQGYSHAEIIAATGWPAGTVKSRLSRARARLREVIHSQSLDLPV